MTIATLAMLSVTAKAQNSAVTGVQPTNLELSNALEISFTGSSSIVNIPFTSLNDMLNGVETATHQIKVRSNKQFKVTVQPSSNTFTYSGTGLINNLLQVSNVMKVRVLDNNTGGTQPFIAWLLGWQSFSSLGTPVTLLNNCNPGSNQTFSVKYKATPGIGSIAGNYSTEMIYTATQQ